MKKMSVWSRLASVSIVITLGVVLTSCTKSSPVRPSESGTAEQGASVTDASTGVTVTTPSPVTPNVNQQFRFVEQPVRLTIKNAAATGSAPLTYTFQVASDAGFNNIAYTKEAAEGSGGQTSLVIDKLAGDKTYFWRARANSGGVQGL